MKCTSRVSLTSYIKPMKHCGCGQFPPAISQQVLTSVSAFLRPLFLMWNFFDFLSVEVIEHREFQNCSSRITKTATFWGDGF